MTKLFLGDCLEKIKCLPDNSVDAIVSDPPYGLSFMGKKWDYDVPSVKIWKECLRVLKPGGYLLAFAGSRTYHVMAMRIENAGFDICDQLMWIYGSGFPKSHNISKAIDEKSGGSSTPAGKKYKGWGTALKPAHEPIVMAQKPVSEDTIESNVLKWGTGAINVDASRIGTDEKLNYSKSLAKGVTWVKSGSGEQSPQGRWPANVIFDEEAAAMLDEQSGTLKSGNLLPGHKQTGHGDKYSFRADAVIQKPYGGDSGGASRFFLVVKKDPSDTFISCGQGNIEIDATSVGKKTENKSESLSTDISGSKLTDSYLLSTISIIATATRSIMIFPILNACTKMFIGNITILSDKIIDSFSAENVGGVSVVSDTEALIDLSSGRQVLIKGTVSIALDQSFKNGGMPIEKSTTHTTGNTASESRFLYQAKASKRERNEGLVASPSKMVGMSGGAQAQGEGYDGAQSIGLNRVIQKQNFHPTVKPIKLMEYLVKLVTPVGGVVLDPFMGSGTTGIACEKNGFSFLGCERDPDYFKIAKARIANAKKS